jgi:ABC-type microcin C transport system permease subunit YejB
MEVPVVGVLIQQVPAGPAEKAVAELTVKATTAVTEATLMPVVGVALAVRA